MTRELSKNLMCILVRGGIEIWLEEGKARRFQQILQNTNGDFIEIGGESINRRDITGVFKATTMEDATRRKNGQWKCKYNTWHSKGEECHCAELQRYKTFKTYDKGFASIQKNS